MTQVQVGASDAPMQIDVCATCHLVWLDDGEEQRLPRPAPAPKPPLVTRQPAVLSEAARKELATWKVGEMQAQYEEVAPPRNPLLQLLAYFDFPILHNAPQPKEPPWVTWGIATLMALASLWSWNEPFLQREFAFLPNAPWRHACTTLITSFFLHADFAHLVGNAYFLIVFGGLVEELVGTLRYVLLVFIASLVGTLAHSLIDPHPEVPLIGASDSISALIVFYALQFPHARIKQFFYHRWLAVGGEMPWRWITLSVGQWLAIWIGFQLFAALQQAHGESYVSSFAHLGGALTGFVAWLCWRR